MNRDDIEKLLQEAADKIDITPTMFESATAKYGAIGAFLEGKGLAVAVSPCGSIVSGTITRPYSKDEDDYYDIDVIVNRTELIKEQCSPNEVRGPVEELLISSDLYRNLVEFNDECITLKYVVDGERGRFRLDLDAAVSDVNNLYSANCETFPEYSTTMIAIARRNSDSWLGSNPEGLSDWFLNINERFAEQGRSIRKSAMFNANKQIYASVADVPDMMDRSALQRAVQIVKRSRDVFFTRCQGEKKIPSCVLTVLVAKYSSGLEASASTLEIIKSFIEGVLADKYRGGGSGQILNLANGKLSVKNPVYNEDMLEDWSQEDTILFFRWIESFRQDLDNLFDGGTKQASAVEAVFGKKIGRNLKLFSGSSAAVIPSGVIPKKPWGL